MTVLWRRRTGLHFLPGSMYATTAFASRWHDCIGQPKLARRCQCAGSLAHGGAGGSNVPSWRALSAQLTQKSPWGDLPGVLTAPAAQTDNSEILNLDNVRESLIRQEDSIIFSLLERAQLKRNAAVYEPDAVPVPGFAPSGRRHSMLEFFLRQTEAMHGRMRRYTSPDEEAFFPDDLPAPVLPPLTYKPVLHPAARDVNFNAAVAALYLQRLLPAIAAQGDDGNYGSSALGDVACLQALSKRIHYGKFVAEAKYAADPARFVAAIAAGDGAAILAALTYPDVEARVVARVRRKAAIFGQDLSEVDDAQGWGPPGPGGGAPPEPVFDDDAAGKGRKGKGKAGKGKDKAPPAPPAAAPVAAAPARRYRVHPDTVAELYRDWIMPLTKEVQVEYLLRRLDPWDGRSTQAAREPVFTSRL